MKIKKISKTLYLAGQFFNKMRLKKLNFQLNDNATDKMDRAHIVIANHCSVMDYRITTFAMRKNKAYHVTTKSIFAGKKFWLNRVGALPKVQFVPSFALVKQVKQVTENGNHVLVFAEGAVSFDGTNRIIDKSISKLIKRLGIPVAVINIKGTYLAKPRYNESKFKKVDKIVADFDIVLNENQIEQMSVDQIHQKVVESLHFDVWQWNKQNNVKTFGNLVEGLDNLLFECVYCKGKMMVEKDMLVCQRCGKQWYADEYYRLHNANNELTIAQWFDNQRKNIFKQLKADEFCLQAHVKVQLLNGFKGFNEVGYGIFTQGVHGVTFNGVINGEQRNLVFESIKHWSVPVGNHFVELSQCENTYRFVFAEGGIAIKSAIAIEEAYKLIKQN